MCGNFFKSGPVTMSRLKANRGQRDDNDDDMYEGYNMGAAEAFTIAKTAYGNAGGLGAPTVRHRKFKQTSKTTPFEAGFGSPVRGPRSGQ